MLIINSQWFKINNEMMVSRLKQLVVYGNVDHQLGVVYIYYTPEVRRGEYWGLGVLLLQYFPLVRYEIYCTIIA